MKICKNRQKLGFIIQKTIQSTRLKKVTNTYEEKAIFKKIHCIFKHGYHFIHVFYKVKISYIKF